MNITKFGAFVNILPGRDGLVHISKMGGGKRIDQVEDVLDLGDEIEVRSTTSTRAARSASARSPRSAAVRAAAGGGRQRRPPVTRSASAGDGRGGDDVVSFEDAFDAEVREEFGDLGPAAAGAREGGGGGGRGGDRGGRAAAVEAAAAAVTAVAGADGERPPVRLRTEPIRSTVLASGIRVVTERMPEVRSVTLGCWVAVGGRDEPDGARAAPRTSSSTCCSRAPTTAAAPRDRGVGRRARRRDERLHRPRAHRVLRCGCRRASSPSGSTCSATSSPAPAFRPDEVDAERQVILEELAAQRGRARRPGPHPRAWRRCSRDHPLGREVLGTDETIEAMDRDEIAGVPRRALPAGQPRGRRRR